MVLFVAIQVPFQQHRLQRTIDSIEILLQTLVERDREQLANEIFDARLTAIDLRIKEMRKVEGILGICILSATGKQLGVDGLTPGCRKLSKEGIEGFHQTSRIQKKQWEGRSILQYQNKIDFLGEKLGYIQINYSLESVESDQKTAFIIVGSLLVTVLIVMLVALNLILSRAILQPITYLRDATKLIVQGNLESEIDTARKDELGSLADSLDKMRDAIKEKISDLKRITNIIESTSDLVAVTTPDQRVQYMNRAGYKMLGLKEDELPIGQRIIEGHPDWAYQIIMTIGTPAAISEGTWEGETAVLHSDGTEIPVSQVLISHLDANGNVEYLSTIIRDITAPKRAEKELRYLRNYLGNIINSMPSVLIGVDSESRVTQWNSEAQRATGISPKKALGRALADVFPRLAASEERVQQAMQERRIVPGSRQAYHAGGETCYEEVTIYPLISDGLEGAVIRIDDVTEKVRMEEMMIQSEKMLSVGGLAAGMAHEINNPLAGMMQSANVLESRLTDVKMRANQEAAVAQGISMQAIQDFMEARDIPKMLDQIRESGKRASVIITNMLSFARKSDASSGYHGLVELLDQTTELAGSDYDLKKKFDFRQIDIIREYEEGLPDVPCEPGKIQQVLLNILRNGAEAMQDGRVKAKDSRTASNDVPPQFILRLVHESLSDMVRVEIEDNGPGMDEETRKRIFEPFFTTKPTGSGTGLGLSVSYFIITENHGGTMSVASTPGEGTTFVFRLPVKGSAPS